MKRNHRLLFLIVLILLFASRVRAADVHWVGNAQNVAQVSTITVSGTWAAADTATITINNKNVTVTVGSATATTDIAEILERAINESDTTTDLLGNETRNVGGQSIPEFTEVIASASGSTLTLTSTAPGVPFTVTRSESTAGSGALGAVTAVTAATGKNWLSNAANYSGGAVPVDNDTLYFDVGDVDVLYALDHFRTNNIDLNFIITDDWRGQMGLPYVHEVTGVGTYIEYRTRYLQYRGGGKFIDVLPGLTTAADQGMLWIDCTDQASLVVSVRTVRGSTANNDPHVMLAGGESLANATVLSVSEGSVFIQPPDAPVDSGKTFTLGGVIIGTRAGTSPPYVQLGAGVRCDASTTIDVEAGTLLVDCDTDSTAPSTIEVFGGTVELRGNQDHGNLLVRGGVVYPVSPNDVASVKVFNGGSFDARRALGNISLGADTELYSGASFYDPSGRVIGQSLYGFKTVGCGVQDLTALQLPNDIVFLP